MKKIFRGLLLLFVLVGIGKSGFAQEVTSIPAEHPSLYKGARPLGMGNAFVAMPGMDENAPFYNPAAINDYEKKFHFRIFSPLVDFSPGMIGLVQDVIDLADDIDNEPTDGGKVDRFNDFVDEHVGQFESASLSLPIVQVQHKWLTATVLADSRNTISFRNRAFTNVEIFSRSDMGGMIGSAFGLFNDQLQIGANVKVLHRLVIDEIVSTDDIINSDNFDDAIPRRRATGVGGDVGVKGKIPSFGMGWLEFLKPSLGVTWQDVGNTRFGNGVPDTKQSISAGFALNPIVNKWEFHIANDFRELNQSVSFMKMWNVGAEVMAPQLAKFFRPSIRVGAHQGYIAGGASLDFRFVKLEFATYGEEAGVVSRQKELRRIAGNLSFGF